MGTAASLHPRPRLVIVGNGMVPGRMLDHLLEASPARWDVTIFNAEPRVNYDRIMLSPVLSGEKSYEQIIIHDESWYARRGILLHKGRRVVAIDRAARTVFAHDGTRAQYDKLVIATGSSPIVIPVPGHDLPGVVTYRDLDDVETMLSASQRGGHAVVIGGGLLGLEAAAGLKMRGMEVTVLHLMPTLMERQLDSAAGYLLEKTLEARGIRIRTGADTKAILGDTCVTGVRLTDGAELAADMVVMAVGIRPSTALAKAAGLEVRRGVVVDDHLRTSDPDILALGECAEHRGQCYGLVAPLYEMANVAAANLCGNEDAAYQGSVTSTRLKVTGVDLFSAGDFSEREGREDVVLRDASRGIYKRVVLEGSCVVGAVLYGDTADGAWLFDLMRKRTDVSDFRDTIVFGNGFSGGTPPDPTAAVAALPDEAEVCGCNGVCKSRIVGAIQEKGLTSIDDVRACTKASASCGSCTGIVEQLLRLQLGAAYDPSPVAPVCSCTSLGHDDVRRLIVARELKSIPAIMQELEWKSAGGCARCRPALNYYLLATWPGENTDDPRSRFVNERLHANIQKDGTYSVVPRMWGGVTSSSELRALADVVDKFAIPTVKVTGGQRIDLLGVRKQDLPAVWSDLGKAGLVSGHAYGKALRTVKTCVGSEWCRFGTQDSTALGIRIEKFMWGSWTPAKVKMAVSGCPRNCAESTCKDVGVVCVESGYEIHFGGASGLEVRQTDVLTHVRTEQEALEVIVALVQLYREQGRYLERIYKWEKRVGIDSIRACVVDDLEKRRALYDRFVYSQKFSQHDPWAERASGGDAAEFAAMADLRSMEANP
ncbi:MAG TPA: nitrite reductase large subunit NirB [Candidatus Binatia bacterium]|nr:nitrite reductase large subunit NirB [Candidatus Binatia bacterium]